MAQISGKWQDALQKKETVYYLASTEQALLREAAGGLRAALLSGEEETDHTRIDGPVPDMGAVIEAAGTVSFFGTRRLVEIREASPSAMTDKDVQEMADLFGQVESAVLLVTALFKDKRTADSQKAKKLLQAAQAAGFAAQLAKPTLWDNLAFVGEAAAQLGAEFAPGAAESLLERAGEDRTLLAHEVEKLAAMSGYGTISRALVAKYSVHNIEADVFELARLITSRRKGQAYEKLQDLFALRHEPIAISAALAGTFVDMYRVRCGSEAKRSVAEIFKEMGYKGNDYRLKKAKENAAPYTTRQLEECVLLLYRLDSSLKSSALADKSILLEAAVGRILAIGEAR